MNILITGASRGIGRQLALSYAAPGVNLILIATHLQTLQDVALDCQKLGAKVTLASIDVRDALSMESFILDVDLRMPIDLVIANAGVSSTLQQGWQQEAADDIEKVFAVNVQGTFNTITPLINKMMARRHGQIVLMSSLAALRGLPQSPSYCASKAAVHIYGQSLRAWLARYNVKVNVICPGYVHTDMSLHLIGPKPFLMSSQKAARTIQKGIRKNKACLAFPWQLSVLTKVARLLPTKPVDSILNRFDAYVKR